MDDVKKTYRDAETGTKEAWRNADGTSPKDPTAVGPTFTPHPSRGTVLGTRNEATGIARSESSASAITMASDSSSLVQSGDSV